MTLMEIVVRQPVNYSVMRPSVNVQSLHENLDWQGRAQLSHELMHFKMYIHLIWAHSDEVYSKTCPSQKQICN